MQLGMLLVFLWGWGHNVFYTCSLFLPISASHFIVCSYIETPLEWFDPFPAFYHFLLCIHRFLAKSRVHTWLFGQKSRIHVDVWPKSMYTCKFLAKSHVHTLLFFIQSRTSSLLVEFDVVGSCWVGYKCCWVFLSSDVVNGMLLLWPETIFSLIFIW